jgi:hypothetical protein
LTGALVVVEGATDRAFVDAIARRLGAACEVYVMRGNRPEKVGRYLKALARRFSKAIVLKDLHRGGVDRASLIDEAARLVSRLEGLKAHVIQVRRSIESWILAGLSASSPEDVADPEGELKELIRRRGGHYVKSPEAYRRLAEEVDVGCAVARSKTFRDFVECLESRA